MREKFAALKKNEIQNLVGGNVVSLLPDALCFEVICEGTFHNKGLTPEEANTPKEISTEDFPSVVSADTNEKAKAYSKVSSGTESYSTFTLNHPVEHNLYFYCDIQLYIYLTIYFSCLKKKYY